MRIWLIEAKDSFVPRLFCFYQPTSKCDPDASRSNRYISCFLNFSLPGGSNRVIPVYVRRIGKYYVKSFYKTLMPDQIEFHHLSKFLPIEEQLVFAHFEIYWQHIT